MVKWRHAQQGKPWHLLNFWHPWKLGWYLQGRARPCIYENGLGDALPSRKSTVGIYHAHSDTNTTEHLKYGVGRHPDVQLGGKGRLQSCLSGMVSFLKKAATNVHGTLPPQQAGAAPSPLQGSAYFALHATPGANKHCYLLSLLYRWEGTRSLYSNAASAQFCHSPSIQTKYHSPES